ncbi:Uncharacterised protein [Chlamydia trachomatis]|nr:Uncharacterised protein [Chlamydia trachomatis]
MVEGGFRLDLLLETAKLARSTYYYQLKQLEHGDKDKALEGNSPDNGMMESFFGILKSEMFYGYEEFYKSLEELESAIKEYIVYYNNKRIKTKLKGLSTVQYRTQSCA